MQNDILKKIKEQNYIIYNKEGKQYNIEGWVNLIFDFAYIKENNTLYRICKENNDIYLSDKLEDKIYLYEKNFKVNTDLGFGTRFKNYNANDLVFNIILFKNLESINVYK